MDNALNELKKSIRLARQTAGLTREALLIKALNYVFDQHVATEADWKSASLEACGAWRRQMTRLLDALLFAACSADAYSGEDAQLGRAVEEIQEALESTRQRIVELEQQANDLRRELDAENREAADLEKEVELLTSLKELLPMREAFLAQRAHALANERIAAAMEENDERLQTLRERIDADLAAQDRSLRQALMEKEKQWEEIRNKPARM